MPTPLLPVELEALIAQNITDELDQQNTAQRVREVLLYMVASIGLPTTPGTPINPDYAALMAELAKKADKTAVQTALNGKEPSFKPFAQNELATIEYAYSNLALRPLLRALIKAVASGVGGGSGALISAITVSLSGGKTAGTIKDGDVIDAGTTYEALFGRMLVEDIYPTYTVAHVEVSQSAPADGEVGESVSNTITGIFFQGEAGPLAAMREYRGNQAQIGASDTASPIVRTTQMVRGLSPTGIWAVADYAAGAKKLVQPAGTPDTRPAQVRNPNAPQAAEVGLSSPIIYFTGYPRLFFGPASSAPTNRADAVALGGTQLTNAGNSGTLHTGTTALKQVILLPPGRTLTSVTDIDNQGLNLTAKYVAQSTISVADAGGNAVAGYTPYVLSIATPYTADARHVFQYA